MFDFRDAAEKIGQERLVQRTLEQVTADPGSRVDHLEGKGVELMGRA